MSREVAERRSSLSKIKQWLKQDLPAQRFNAGFGGAFVTGYNFRYKMKKLPTHGMSATITDEANVGTYISAKRVIAGGVLFGPLGALTGAVLRKNGSKVFVVVERDEEVVGTLEGGAKDVSNAHQFVDALNRSANDPDNN